MGNPDTGASTNMASAPVDTPAVAAPTMAEQLARLADWARVAEARLVELERQIKDLERARMMWRKER